jgi:eukaryotic-like serine/threonine-protein kinase
MNNVHQLIGQTTGTYQIQGILGVGGTSCVYQAFDTKLQRPVALKMLTKAASKQPGFEQRFRQEALILARMRHPHIVQIYDFGEHNGMLYIVQELLPGPTLEQWLNDLASLGQHLPRQAVLTIIDELASALDGAHAAGVIHRDVKPGNAIWNAAAALVLVDFGIARPSLDARGVTGTGGPFGTPTYMAPEQVRGLPVTPASDTYALGVVLYELLTGNVPFDQALPMDVALQHIQAAPPPLQITRPDLPPAMEAVVQRALSKEPSERFQSAGDLARALVRAWPAAAVDALARPALQTPAPTGGATQKLSARPSDVSVGQNHRRWFGRRAHGWASIIPSTLLLLMAVLIVLMLAAWSLASDGIPQGMQRLLRRGQAAVAAGSSAVPLQQIVAPNTLMTASPASVTPTLAPTRVPSLPPPAGSKIAPITQPILIPSTLPAAPATAVPAAVPPHSVPVATAALAPAQSAPVQAESIPAPPPAPAGSAEAHGNENQNNSNDNRDDHRRGGDNDNDGRGDDRRGGDNDSGHGHSGAGDDRARSDSDSEDKD